VLSEGYSSTSSYSQEFAAAADSAVRLLFADPNRLCGIFSLAGHLGAPWARLRSLDQRSSRTCAADSWHPGALWAGSCRRHSPATLAHASRTPLASRRCLLPRWLTLPVRCSRVAGTLRRDRSRQAVMGGGSAAMRDASERRYGVRQAREPCVVIFALLREKRLCRLLLRWVSCVELMCGLVLTGGSVRSRRWSQPRAKVDTDAWKARRSSGRGEICRLRCRAATPLSAGSRVC
jgi:hypothetical protein